MKKFTILRTLLMSLRVLVYMAPVIVAVLCFVVFASHILQGALVSAFSIGFLGWLMLKAHNGIDKEE